MAVTAFGVRSMHSLHAFVPGTNALLGRKPTPFSGSHAGSERRLHTQIDDTTPAPADPPDRARVEPAVLRGLARRLRRRVPVASWVGTSSVEAGRSMRSF